jgi:hypothetical protein
MSIEDLDIRTADGEEIIVGESIYAEDPGRPPLEGKVTNITEPEGELNESGQMIAIHPKVSVEWSNGDKEVFDATPLFIDPNWEAEKYECDELYDDRGLVENMPSADDMAKSDGLGLR